MEENEAEKKVLVNEKLKDLTEQSIENTIKEGITTANLDLLGKLVDIHKDISQEEYWKRKEKEFMNYGNYGNYGNYNGNYGREQYGNYGEYGRENYGRRGVDRKYRGHDKIDRMYGEYGRYEEGREQYNAGNYGAKEDTMKSLKYMLESMVDFVEMLKSEANSQEEVQLIKQYTQRIAQM